MKRPEQALQISIVQWMRYSLPREVVFFHVPNGGKRTKAEAGIFKAMGVVSGIPDLIIAWPGTVLAVELKAGSGASTPLQKDMQDRLKAVGWHVAEIRSLDEFIALLGRVGAPRK